VSGDERTSGRATEDLHFGRAEGPASYAYTASGPVRYVVVATADDVLGYLWASDADDAAGFEPRAGAGDDAVNAGVFWYQELRRAKARGLRPSQAVAALAAAGAGGARVGRAVGGSEGEAPSQSALATIASHR
jgi:hypothetical protein